MRVSLVMRRPVAALALVILLAGPTVAALPGSVIVYQRVLELGTLPNARVIVDESFSTSAYFWDIEPEVTCTQAYGTVVGSNAVDTPLADAELEFVAACVRTTQTDVKDWSLFPGKHRVFGEFVGTGRVTVTLWGQPS